uniref:Uncharacterized protein n=1 Tax=Anopheles christyi TaxID=43041 RepID=A0A182KAW8_9DIPT
MCRVPFVVKRLFLLSKQLQQHVAIFFMPIVFNNGCNSKIERKAEGSSTCPQCRKGCTRTGLVKLYLNVESNPQANTSQGNANSLEEKLNNLTLKIHQQENLLTSIKSSAVQHEKDQREMKKTLSCLEGELRSKNSNKSALRQMMLKRYQPRAIEPNRNSSALVLPSCSSRSRLVDLPDRTSGRFNSIYHTSVIRAFAVDDDDEPIQEFGTRHLAVAYLIALSNLRN